MISCSWCCCCLSLAVLPSVWSWLSAFHTLSFVKDTPFFLVLYLSKFYLSFYVSLNFCLFREAIQMPSSQNLLLKVIAANLSFHCGSCKSHCLLANTFCLSFRNLIVYLSSLFSIGTKVALVQFMCFFVSQLCLIKLFCKI